MVCEVFAAAGQTQYKSASLSFPPQSERESKGTKNPHSHQMAQSLELLLIQFLMPDNDARRQAEDQIKRLAKDPQVVPALVQHMRTAKTPNVRQLAAVLLRKKITGHWAKLSPQLKQLVMQSLIETITMEHRFLFLPISFVITLLLIIISLLLNRVLCSPPVRKASANVVSIVAKYAVPSGEWPDLLPFLFQCSQSSQDDHREVSAFITLICILASSKP